MNLKELIKEVERLEYDRNTTHNVLERVNIERQLRGIKQTVEAVDKLLGQQFQYDPDDLKDWQKLKELLGLK